MWPQKLGRFPVSLVKMNNTGPVALNTLKPLRPYKATED